jgi:hypothetical protein
MAYYTKLDGCIFMSKEIFDDLMDNELNFNKNDCLLEDDENKWIVVPDKVMLKDYFDHIEYVGGAMIINSDGNKHPQNKGIFESVARKLGENDMGHIEIVGEEGDSWCYWLAKDKLAYGEWKKPEAPDWFKE